MIVEYDCAVCDAHVRVRRSPSTIKVPPRYCSQTCHGADRKGSGRGPTPNREYNCKQCGTLVHVYRSPSAENPGFCSLACLGVSQSGEGNYFWAGGAQPMRNGYTRTYSFGRQAYTHRAVVEQHIGRRLARREVVHHINRDKSDNRIENLQLLPDQSVHAAIHAREDRGF